MFSEEFYPTSVSAWEAMNADSYGKRVLDPSAGKGTLLRYAEKQGAASVEGIEKNDELRRLLSTKYPVIGVDWFDTKAEDISHVNLILMNPPYNTASAHILHAWKIAPEGCEIIAQCNANTLSNDYSRGRAELSQLIKNYGSKDPQTGNYYKEAERTTCVEVAIIRLFKPVTTENPDFEGFYNDMPEFNEIGGVVKYNEIQAIVNNYTGAIRCFDRFAKVGNELNSICKQLSFGGDGYNFKVSSRDSENNRESEIIDKGVFARQLQKRCWKMVFEKFDLEKYLTKGVMNKVNEFVESRLNYPFTMKNIYRMVEIIVGTSASYMESAIVEAVDNFTKHTEENRFNVEGWKTNSGHMLNRKFITPYICETRYSYETANTVKIDTWKGNFLSIMDLTKALCFLTGKDFNTLECIKSASLSEDEMKYLEECRILEKQKNIKFNPLSIPDKLHSSLNKFQPNKWYDWGFFRFKVYKKGTGHFEFKNIEDWAKLNQAYGKAKGNPLPEVILKRERHKQAA